MRDQRRADGHGERDPGDARAGEPVPAPSPTGGDGGHGSLITVLFALGANLGVAAMKLAAGLITGSAAMLSEAAHSVGDCFTEVMLLTALRRSGRPADRRHPFGYGKERYFWGLFASVAIFASGAMFSIYEGVRTIVSGSDEQTAPWVAYVVILLAFGIESVSWTQATRQVRREAADQQRPFLSYLRSPDDPSAKTVFLEDSAALVGLVLAAAGVGAHQLTGSGVWDGVASVLIGALLVWVAFRLAATNKELLVGQQAHLGLVLRIHDWLTARKEVTRVVDLLTMLVGTDRVLLCARIDFADQLSVAELEHTCVRLNDGLRAEFPDLDEIFLEPVPSDDPSVLARVRARYGSRLTALRSQLPEADVPDQRP
ncbi:cation diffusion facilitator family transporter [Marinactinospora thermotolerans]|uniref:Cation diffusion facilitator family transporter n=1 Tax=Marinactinospora thermotolerans DSM 45154 TaxID=1122192 RepID=A0A1T4TEP5_9ACTN|nr:cation diffusion facilitator family transporter [Marinactinospora thermotolerans]SKA38965.1 cation diffusion facilitator family transporter [Marinactinospora thermotolerans DSM 45154]